jgi:hypothetical protein
MTRRFVLVTRPASGTPPRREYRFIGSEDDGETYTPSIAAPVEILDAPDQLTDAQLRAIIEAILQHGGGLAVPVRYHALILAARPLGLELPAVSTPGPLGRLAHYFSRPRA